MAPDRFEVPYDLNVQQARATGHNLCPVLRILGPAPKPLWCANEPSWGLWWPRLLALAPLIDMPEKLPSISGIPDCRVTGRISGVSTKDEGTPWRPGSVQWIADTTPQG